MADIVHEFTVKAQPERVFQLFATPEGMEKWWTKAGGGNAARVARCTCILGATSNGAEE